MNFQFPSLPLLLFPLLFLISCDREKSQQSTPPSSDTSSSNPSKAPRTLQEAKQDPKLAKVLDTMRKRQAAGLGTGSVQVNGAWTYTGYSYLDAVPGARLVAVDVTVSGHTIDFDFDDIEIIDGSSRISYGSDPHITLLSPEGKALPDLGQMPAAPNPVRVLLIYGFPKETHSFTLYYWGNNLLLKNHGIKERGWELPFPKKEAK